MAVIKKQFSIYDELIKNWLFSTNKVKFDGKFYAVGFF